MEQVVLIPSILFSQPCIPKPAVSRSIVPLQQGLHSHGLPYADFPRALGRQGRVTEPWREGAYMDHDGNASSHLTHV